MKKLAEERGFTVQTEMEILDGHGYVDASLVRADTRIAVEISVSTRINHEIGNLTKCLGADFAHVVFLSSSPAVLKAARALMPADTRLHFVSPDNLITLLDRLDSPPIEAAPEGRTITARQDEAARGNARLTTWDAATYTGVARQTLSKLRVTGGGPPFHKLGSRVVYERDDLDAWMAERKRSSTSDRGGR